MTRLEQLVERLKQIQPGDKYEMQAYWTLRDYLDKRNDAIAVQLLADDAVTMQAAARSFDNAELEVLPEPPMTHEQHVVDRLKEIVNELLILEDWTAYNVPVISEAIDGLGKITVEEIETAIEAAPGPEDANGIGEAFDAMFENPAEQLNTMNAGLHGNKEENELC